MKSRLFPSGILIIASFALLHGCGSHPVVSQESIPASVASQPTWQVYYGNLHSHSDVSDGVETPTIAYSWAKDTAKLNFLCLSEHNHIVKLGGDTALVDINKPAAEQATTNSFVGLVGQEYSTLPPNGGNHINVHDVLERIPAELNNDYRKLFREWLPGYVQRNPSSIVVCQFNHPENIERDYGIARIGGFANYDGSWSQFTADVEPWVRLIAVISGPADSNTKKTDPSPVDAHRDTDETMLRIWHKYLDRGFHLSPVGDQDNHRKSWGTRTTARTGVWIQGAFSKQSLLKALKNGACFATEDKNLSVWFTVNGRVMGTRLPDPGDKDLAVQVKVEDTDEPDSKYVVQVFRDVIGDGDVPLALEPSHHVSRGETLSLTFPHKGGQHELYLVHVSQEGSTDDAWTAPIWIDPAQAPETPEHTEPVVTEEGTKFVGSKNSTLYHLPECSSAKQITAANLVEYKAAPAGKTLHTGCPK